MDDLERNATATLLTSIAIVAFSACALGVASLWLNPAHGGMAALGPEIVKLLLSFAALILSGCATIAASIFRRRSAWMLVLQIPGFLFFVWLWWHL